jgi:transposase
MEHPSMGLTNVYAAIIPDLLYKAAVHVNYQESVLPIKDGLPKFKDLPYLRTWHQNNVKQNRFDCCAIQPMISMWPNKNTNRYKQKQSYTKWTSPGLVDRFKGKNGSNIEESISNQKYTEEFKSEVIRQVTERGYKVRGVSERLGISSKSLYQWMRLARYSNDKLSQWSDKEMRQEIVGLKSELKRAEEEREILKKANEYFAKASR